MWPPQRTPGRKVSASEPLKRPSPLCARPPCTAVVINTAAEMRLAGNEAASAINHRPGLRGVAPALMLLGQRLKLHGEPFAGGMPVSRHPEGDDAASALARRFRPRTAARQALDRYHATELLKRAVEARSSVLENVEIGDVVFFYRS